ncbi:helix-turn-helix domain-containing protein [Aestuariicella hydrocarbonica]|uniref:Helix-turn-helix domain-containing protein n=1 Tax=Pseudomaricurvus hydrocarbonicus TaxID=1470433 RepID=A0A9E5JY30_9GAMM|nr:helix-turn-helix domain-containing protein [Aestuariicella hydrocarbonica]NHO66746.1 helix-turn-helix domain-containing protein [Aestuariicella hydrocarbonica]
MSLKTTTSEVPSTDFYGESTLWPVTDLVYSEQLSLRSALYDWQIKPHKHQDLMQIFYVESGSGSAQVDDRSLQIASGDLLVVPDQCVHTFRWAENSSGYVLFIARPLITKLDSVIGPLPWCHGNANCFPLGDDQSFIITLLTALHRECEGNQPDREISLENQALSLFIWLKRQHCQSTSENQRHKHKSQHKLDKFIHLLEEHHCQQHSVNWYAKSIGVSAPHLNSLCKHYRQQTALGLIHQRLLSEAQRQLIYTNKTAAEIADMLGFADAAYFSRFFKRLSGVAPKTFRHQDTRSP